MIKYNVINKSKTEDFGETNEYEIFIKIINNYEKIYSLHRSNSTTWTSQIRGEKILEIIDTGNNLILPIQDNVLTYTEASELYILLNFINLIEDKSLYEGEIQVVDYKNTFVI